MLALQFYIPSASKLQVIRSIILQSLIPPILSPPSLQTSAARPPLLHCSTHENGKPLKHVETRECKSTCTWIPICRSLPRSSPWAWADPPPPNNFSFLTTLRGLPLPYYNISYIRHFSGPAGPVPCGKAERLPTPWPATFPLRILIWPYRPQRQYKHMK